MNRKNFIAGIIALVAYALIRSAEAQGVLLFGGAGGTAVDLNFAAGSYAGGSLASMVSVSRAATAFAPNANGSLTSFAPNTPRITNLGLWKEPTRTNILVHSGDASQWNHFNNGTGTFSVTANSGIAPDGTTTAALATINRSDTASWAAFTPPFQPTVAGYAGSVYVQASTSADVDKEIQFLFKNGTTVAGVTTLTLTAGWQRVFIPSSTLDATVGWQFTLGYLNATGVPAGQTGPVNFYVWGGQIELGANPTTYIPTTTASATRDTDVVSFSGALATALASSTATLEVTTNQLIQATANTFIAANGVDLLGKLSTDFGTTSVGAVLSATTTGAWSATATMSLAWDGTGGEIQLNSGPVSTDATARAPSAPFTMGDASFIGAIAQIQVYGTKLPLAPASSFPITGVTFATPYLYNSTYPTQSVGTDTFYSTWADDGNIYTTTCDMVNGWNGAGGNSNITISELSGFAANSTTNGSLINNMITNFGNEQQAGTDTYNYKTTGLISVNGVLYAAVGRMANRSSGTSWLQYQRGSQIIKSSDHGATWTPLPPSQANPYVSPMFPGTSFSAPSPVQYNQDYQNNTVDNSGTYVYWTSTDALASDGNYLYLARVLIADLPSLDPTKYSYYSGTVGADITQSSNWSSSFSSATPIISSPGNLGANAPFYLPLSKRYIYVGTRYPTVHASTPYLDTSNTQFSIFEAPHLNGPYTLVQTVTWNPLGLYFPVFIPKSLTVDSGNTAVIATAGNYSLSSITGLYTLILASMNIHY